MAPPRPRNSKRGSSSSSYTSTITTVAFIALCVVGVWMLTSNSGVPPQTTNRMSKDSTFTTTGSGVDTDVSSSIKNNDISGNNFETEVSSSNAPEKTDSVVTNNAETEVSSSNEPEKTDSVVTNVETQVSSSNEPEKTDSVVTNNVENEVSSSVEPEKTDSLFNNNVETEISSSSEPEKTDAVVTNNVETDVSSTTDLHKTNASNKTDQPVFEDNPGDLPPDAIKSDEPKTNDENEKDKQDSGLDSKTVEGDKQKEKHNQMTQNQQADQASSDAKQQKENEKNSKNENVDQASESAQQGNAEKEKQMVDSGKISQDSGSQVGNGDQQQQETQQNAKSYEEQQHEQRLEDAGILTVSQDSQNDVSDEDQKQRMAQQQQKQQEQKQVASQNQETQQQEGKQAHSDITNTGTQQNQESEKTTESADNQVDNDQATKQEASVQDTTTRTKATESNAGETSFPGNGASGIPKESKESKKSWSTQASESENEKERRKEESDSKESIYGYKWHLCNVTAGPDYIPCLDNERALKQLRSTKHFEHRERHCPEEGPTCLVSVPEGYKRPITWPKSREKIWYHNVPHTLLAEVKGHQNWVKVTGEFLTFPGGGTQFIHGALHYIDFVEKAVPNIQWGKHTRVILDVGCGVASFGGYLFEKDALTMSFAPKDEHEAQVQFALERGIPAISAVMGSQRLPFPSRVFDLVHCARCRVPWHAEGGLLLLELNRVLRPGGYFVWSATPVYQKLKEDVEIWQAMSALTVSMCWELVTIKKDKINSIGAAIYRKPMTNDCYDQRKKNTPPMCKSEDDPDAAWYVPLQACMHRVPVEERVRGSHWPVEWPSRLQSPPYWLNSSQMGIYGKPAHEDFSRDYEHWKQVVGNSYMKGLGISWSNVRNVMDMRAVYGGFAAALKDLQVWVINVVNVDSPDTLPIIYERGLFGIYHDWCESFSTYPRTYDLLHADHLFSKLKKRCKLAPVLAEVDRIVRPGGKLIVRDKSSTIGEVENLLKSLRWEVHLTFSKDQEGMLSAQKGDWRPQTFAVSS
ncbi:hypothetical protein K2173_023371 [Erythroxylum novogranatense]|uniref:Uncharacterized protein n=1 Tax=Erythroxylum novogranatense TaxID=1862640 RepID=A0AAV8TWY7_9ROSI|nr:hypothetical protein K2173_023371 [Erythroxylum novogranatense]